MQTTLRKKKQLKPPLYSEGGADTLNMEDKEILNENETAAFLAFRKEEKNSTSKLFKAVDLLCFICNVQSTYSTERYEVCVDEHLSGWVEFVPADPLHKVLSSRKEDHAEYDTVFRMIQKRKPRF